MTPTLSRRRGLFEFFKALKEKYPDVYNARRDDVHKAVIVVREWNLRTRSKSDDCHSID